MDEASTARYHRFNHLYYPDKILLLENFIKTLLKEPGMGAWPSTLKCWAIPYLYGMLMIEDSALDMSDDEQVKEWFNKNIRRWEGGFDRMTVSKRVGRVQRDVQPVDPGHPRDSQPAGTSSGSGSSVSEAP